jgi:hypothetical protein
MQALISPNEPVYFNGAQIGSRIAQVEPDGQTFPVAAPLFWTACPMDCAPDTWYYNGSECLPVPQPTPPSA